MQSVEPDDLRVSTAQREQVGSLLQEALSQGMIDLDEFGDRFGVAMAARTRRELDAVLADLPLRLDHPSPAPAPAYVPPPLDDGPPLVLRAGLGNVRQAGRWEVPRQIDGRCTLGNLKIDFSEAVCRHREVRLNLRCGWGDITVIVPRGWSLRFETMAAGAGNVTNRVTADPEPGYPVLLISGKAGAGKIKFRHPFW